MTSGTQQEGANSLIAFLHAHHNLIYEFLSVLCNCAVVDSIRLGPYGSGRWCLHIAGGEFSISYKAE
jgi:hypothetical protein